MKDESTLRKERGTHVCSYPHRFHQIRRHRHIYRIQEYCNRWHLRRSWRCHPCTHLYLLPNSDIETVNDRTVLMNGCKSNLSYVARKGKSTFISRSSDNEQWMQVKYLPAQLLHSDTVKQEKKGTLVQDKKTTLQYNLCVEKM